MKSPGDYLCAISELERRWNPFVIVFGKENNIDNLLHELNEESEVRRYIQVTRVSKEVPPQDFLSWAPCPARVLHRQAWPAYPSGKALWLSRFTLT